MKDIADNLKSNDFLRVHRSYIVRVDKISAIEQSNLIMEDDKKIIPIGGSYRDDLVSRLKFV
jgi:DNA-binding LytR/AlgR family response regulator